MQQGGAEVCFTGDGEMSRLTRAHDWSSSPLGPVDRWPQSLQTAVSICLTSRFPIVLWWGPDLRLLNNAAWRPALGTVKHFDHHLVKPLEPEALESLLTGMKRRAP